MKRKLLLICLAWLSTGIAVAQRCGTMENYEMMKVLDPGFESRKAQIDELIQKRLIADPTWRTTGVITIPVVFHVLYSSATQNISTARINAQLDVLNQDYSATNVDVTNVPSVFQPFVGNTGIQFCLAVRDQYGNPTDGIIRKPTTTTQFGLSNGIKFNSTGGDNAWPRDQYLNIWVGNLGSQLLGYAQFPGGAAATDGVVVHYGTVGGPGAMGTSVPYNRGRTATHEIGHWLNLAHINGDQSCGNDSVADTPTQGALNGGCPSFPHISCGNGPNGDMTMNYMDYTNDACMYMFTVGQGARMTTAFNVARVALLNSLGCVPTSVGINEVGQNGISIYPNPTQGLLTIENSGIETGSTNVKVVNVVGQTMMTKTFSDFSGTHYLDISKLSNGLYFVSVENKSGSRVYRVTLQK